jgi:hypothetical protein
MDRTIVYPGSIPLDTDMLSTNRNAMIALGALMSAVLGTSQVIDGLAVRPTVPAGLGISVDPGSIIQLGALDAAAFGSLSADGVSPLVKMGINLASTAFTLTTPTTSGQAIAWLLEAAFQEADTDAATLPYYNAANPAQPFLGPNNSGSAQPRTRTQRVQLQLRAGTPATAGSQIPPSPDAGWAGVAVITTTYAMTQINAVNIATYAGSPIIPFRMPSLRPGFSSMVSYAISGSFIVPVGVSRLRVRVFGGGGGGGGAFNGGQSGGGSGGGYSEGIFTVSPGAILPVTTGAGGNGGSGVPSAGGTGGTSSVSALISATGGPGGNAGNAGGAAPSGAGGVGAGGSVNLGGQTGAGGAPSTLGGAGGGSPMGTGGQGGSQNGGGSAGLQPGGGGGGTAASPSTGYAGGAGGAGLVIIEY